MRADFYTSAKLARMNNKKGSGKKSATKKKMGNDVLYGGPTVKISFFMRGATLFSLPQFKNPKISNFANRA